MIDFIISSPKVALFIALKVLQNYKIFLKNESFSHSFQFIIPNIELVVQTQKNISHIQNTRFGMLKTIFIIILVSICTSRVLQTSMKFSNFGKNDGWIYLDKMSFAPGTVQYKVRTQPKGIPYGAGGSVTVQAIPQNLWQQERQRKCQDIPKQPFLKHRVSVSQSSIDFSRQSFQIQQTTLYYFVLKDCQHSLLSEYQNNNLSLRLELHLLNNGREIGEQQDHWYIVPIIVLAGMWLVYFYNDKMKGKQLKNEKHKMMVFAGIATQVSSLVWKTFGFLIYAYTGSDYAFFHIIYLLMHSISQSLVIGLIILIGFGWTINYNTIKDSDLYIPILACLAFMNAVLTLLTKIQSGIHDRHHIFDNITGHVILGFRLLMLVVFIGGAINTYMKSRQKVKNFFVLFTLFGGLYVAALPIIVFIGNTAISAKDRHEFVFVAIQGLKCLTNIGISFMLNRQKSYYNEISYEKKSFLPEESKYF